MIGFDIDGVLREYPLNVDEMTSVDWYDYVLNCAVKLHPLNVIKALGLEEDTPFIIVTSIKDTDLLDKLILKHWMRDHNIYPLEFYFAAEGRRTFKGIIDHKNKMIRKFNLTHFFEDDPRIFEAIANDNWKCVSVYVPSNYATVRELEQPAFGKSFAKNGVHIDTIMKGGICQK